MNLLFETDDLSESMLLFRKSLNNKTKHRSLHYLDKEHRERRESYNNYFFETTWQNLNFETKNRPRQGFQVVCIFLHCL